MPPTAVAQYTALNHSIWPLSPENKLDYIFFESHPSRNHILVRYALSIGPWSYIDSNQWPLIKSVLRVPCYELEDQGVTCLTRLSLQPVRGCPRYREPKHAGITRNLQRATSIENNGHYCRLAALRLSTSHVDSVNSQACSQGSTCTTTSIDETFFSISCSTSSAS